MSAIQPAVGDVVRVIGRSQSMLVVDLHEDARGLTAAWRIKAGQVVERFFVTARLELVIRKARADQ